MAKVVSGFWSGEKIHYRFQEQSWKISCLKLNFQKQKRRASICEKAHAHPHTGWHQRCGHILQGSCFQSENPLTAISALPHNLVFSAASSLSARCKNSPGFQELFFLTLESFLYHKGKVFPQDKCHSRYKPRGDIFENIRNVQESYFQNLFSVLRISICMPAVF